MSAEVLRQAAALMRGRAEAALPGPWSVDGPWWHPDDDDGPDSSEMVTAGTNRVPVCIDPPRTHHTYRDQFKNAEHIASWHPAVALAVADWLDLCAEYHDELPCPAMDSALEVARAYLGSAP